MDQEVEDKQLPEKQHEEDDYNNEGTTTVQAETGPDVVVATSSCGASAHADDTGSASDDDEDDPQDDEETLQEIAAADALPSPSNAGPTEVLPWPEPLDNDSNAIEVFDKHDAPTKLKWPQLSGCTNAEVLAWVEQHQQVLVRAVTWNLQGKPPPKPSDIHAKLLPANKFHVYVIGSEECERSIASSAVNPSKKVWESFLKGVIGESYTAICSHTLQAIHSIAFVHNALLPIVSNVRTMAVATGVANKLGNKGAVVLTFAVGNTSLLFINAHLAAHQNKVKARNTQYHRIMEAIAQAWCGNDETPSADEPAVSPKTEAKTQENDASNTRISSASVLEAFDRIVFAGDLNYRIRGNRRIVDKLIQSGMQEVLLANDQLLSSVAQKLAFEGFAEGPLNFLPTYKLQRGGDLYDPGPKRRIPAWTDRVLYKPSGCQLLTYRSEPSLKSSDHRPVYASLLMSVQLPSREGATEGKETYNADFVTTSEICAVM